MVFLAVRLRFALNFLFWKALGSLASTSIFAAERHEVRADREASSIRNPKTAQDRARAFIEVDFNLLAHSYSEYILNVHRGLKRGLQIDI